ncbi:MAG: acyl carrier protein [Planctomycetota bacterium]
MDRNEIFEKVQEVLVEALGVDDDEVTADAVIRDDLGAESIDFLDIQFRLEKEFGFKIPRGEMMPENIAQNEEYVKDGKMTEAGITELKSRMPHADFKDFEAGSELDEMSKLFTVDAIVNYVERKLGEGE